MDREKKSDMTITGQLPRFFKEGFDKLAIYHGFFSWGSKSRLL